MISVVIPAFNAEATIERALDSVLGQSCELQVIVVDDGSTDGTAEVVAFHAGRDSRVRLLRVAHGGMGAARNAGIEAATGEWIAFLDADDEYAEGAFETILERVGRREVGLVIFSIEAVRAYIYAWPPPLVRLRDELFEGTGDRADAFMREYVRTKRMLIYSQSNKLYRRSVLMAHGIRFGERVRFGEDRLFNFAYLRHAGAVLTMSDRLLTYHHGTPGRLSSLAPGDGVRGLLALSAAKMNLLRDYGFAPADVEEFRRHDEQQILDDVVVWLIGLDRQGGASAVRDGVHDVLAAERDGRVLRGVAARSRRVRLVQAALQARLPGAATALVHVLRLREDRSVLRRRRREIDRTRELRRLGLESASARERARYIFLADYERLLDRVNDERHRNLLRDKAILLRRLSDAPDQHFLRREWLDLRRASLSDFASLLERCDRIVAKKFDGTWSKGIDVIDVAAGVDPAALHEQLLNGKQYVVEAYLPQHPDLARLYDGALATLRIHTLTLGGRVQAVLPTTIGFGSRGGETSNAWAIQAFVDPESGVITTDGLFQGAAHGVADEVFERHPDSGASIRGAVVPFVAEAARLASEAALRVPELPFIGWDVACTPAGPAIVEGNAAPMIHYSWQVMARRLLGRRGMRAEIESVLDRFARGERQQGGRTRGGVSA